MNAYRSKYGHVAGSSHAEVIKAARLEYHKIQKRNSPHIADTVYSYDNMNVGLHRFYGQTKDGLHFYVQIRENKRTGRKDFMSVFPVQKSK